MREALNLYEHGTEKWHLTPQTILEAARQDINTKAFNRQVRRTRKQHGKGSLARKLAGTERNYAFRAHHVAEASTSADLIRLALERQHEGVAADQVNTRAIYDNRGSLLEALKLAEAEDSIHVVSPDESETPSLFWAGS